jgi:serine/threonine-protein kinase
MSSPQERIQPEPVANLAGGEAIELEPLGSSGKGFRSTDANSIHMAMAMDTLPSLASETGGLLRNRLRSAALFLGAGYFIFLLRGLIDPDSIQRLNLLPLSGLLAFCLAALALFSLPVVLSLKQLRALELVFFGGLVALMMGFQYYVGRELIGRGDLARLVGSEKNGIIHLLIVMTLYAVFIPNDPRATARVVLTMAMGPFLVLLALKLEAAKSSTIADHITSNEFALSNMLFVVLSAALAVYIAYVLNGLRRDLRQARRLGQYRLGEKLGEGGMGEVYLAEHELLKRPCALKLIKPDVDTNPVALARFEREVKSAAMLSHPNTIEIFDFGHTDDGVFYYVMEYLPGLSISELVRQFGPMPPARANYLLRQVCGALAEAHRFGLVHRDLKPANILVAILGGKCDVAKVLDFGLVKLTANPEAPQLTGEYMVSGTPLYMSPEQAMASPTLDGRADLYSLGAILYFMLTGRPPFEGTNPTELMIAHARDPVVPPSRYREEIPADLEAVVMRCLAKHPSERYVDTRTLSMALGECACARDWNEESAEKWWLEQASTRIDAAPVHQPA